MAQSNIQKITTFLRAMRLKEPRPADRVELRQVLTGNRDNRLRDWKLDDECDLDNIALEADNLASDDAEGHGSRQRYYMVAFEGGEVQCGRSAVFAHHIASHEEDTEDSEPATKAGLLSQLMRHNEQDKRTTLNAITSIIESQTRMIDRQGDMIDKLLADRFDTMIRLDEALTAKQERDLEMVREGRKLDMQQRLFNQFQGLLPTLANKILHKGVKLLPEKMTPFEQQIMTLLGTMSKEQLMRWIGDLEPMQQVMALEAYEHAAKLHEEATRKPEDKPEEKKTEEQQEAGSQ